MKSAKENLLKQQDSEVDNIHMFSLKPLEQNSSLISPVKVDFTPLNSESKQISIMPRLIMSDDSFEPLFQIPYIKNLLLINGSVPQTLISGRQGPSKTPLSFKSSQEKIESYKPKPSSKFCQVCKQKFEDYLDHIKHKVHIDNLQSNVFQKYIDLLIQEFKKTNKRSLPVISYSKDEHLFFKPKKKIKNYEQNENYSEKNINSAESTNHSLSINQNQSKFKTKLTQKD